METKPVIITQTMENLPRAGGADYSGQAWLGTPYSVGKADEALLTDPAIAAGWQELSSVMAQAAVGITGADKVPAIHEFLSAMLFSRLNRRFNAIIVDLLQALIYGVQPMQVITAYDAASGRWELKDLLPIPARNFELYSLKYKPGQWWIEGNIILFDGRIIECTGPGQGGALVLWATFGPGLLGRPIIRPVMAYNEEKASARKLRGVGLYKSVLGTLLAFERKPDLNSGEAPMNTEQLSGVSDALAKLTNGAANSSVGTMPYTIDQVTPIYPAADAIGKTVEAENHADMAILQAFGSQHLARGLLSGYGSQGAGQADMQAQQALRGYYYQWIANTLQPVLDWIVDLNFTRPDYYPELHIVSPTAQEPASLINSYCRLLQAGGLEATTADQDYIRQLLRLPARTAGQPVKKQEATGLGAGYYNQATGEDTREPETRAAYYKQALEEA